MFSEIASVYDLMKAHRDYASEAAVIRRLLLAEAPQASSLLEVACGTGSLLQELDEYERTGMDLSVEMLEQARMKLGEAIALHHGDMRHFSLPNRAYDVLVCVDGALGYVSEDDLVGTIGTFADHMARGGILLLEPWYSPEDWLPGRIHVVHHQDGETTVIRVGYGYPNGSIEFHNVVGTARGIRTFDERYEFTLHPHSAITAALRFAGFTNIRMEAARCFKRGLFLARRAKIS